MGGISDLLADLSAGMFDEDPEFLEAVGWDEYDVLHQEGVEHDVRQQQHEHAPVTHVRGGLAVPANTPRWC